MKEITPDIVQDVKDFITMKYPGVKYIIEIPAVLIPQGRTDDGPTHYFGYFKVETGFYKQRFYKIIMQGNVKAFTF